MPGIPDHKRFFRIGEASRIVGVEPYVLRYWESEFPQIRPKRADSNQRTYERRDLEKLLEIKRLLYTERMTLKGAKRVLKKEGRPDAAPSHSLLKEIHSELKEIIQVLSP